MESTPKTVLLDLKSIAAETGYTLVPDGLVDFLASCHIKPTGILVFIHILREATKDPQVFSSKACMAESLGISVRTADRAVSSLKAKSLITVFEGSGFAGGAPEANKYDPSPGLAAFRLHLCKIGCDG